MSPEQGIVIPQQAHLPILWCAFFEALFELFTDQSVISYTAVE